MITGLRKTILLLFLVFAFDAHAQDNISTMLKEADVLVASGNLEGALQKARQAIAVSPENHPAKQKEINILFLMNNEKESMRLADENIKNFPDIPGYYYLRGIINNAKEKYSRALDDFTAALELNPGDIAYRCYLGRGVSYFNLMEYEQALADLTTSIQQNDTVAGSYYSRGMVNYELRDYPAAIADFQKILELSEGNAALYFNLGMAYFRLNEKDKACPNLNKACSMGNTNACRMSLMECAKAIPSQ